MPPFTESVVEATALAWLGSLGWVVRQVHSFGLKAVMRDTLLPKLVTGEIQIKDAGFFLKELGK